MLAANSRVADPEEARDEAPWEWRNNEMTLGECKAQCLIHDTCTAIEFKGSFADGSSECIMLRQTSHMHTAIGWNVYTIPDPLVSIDVVGGQIVFGGTSSYEGEVGGNPSIVAGPNGVMDGILFAGNDDKLQLGTEGIDTDASWTIDCYFKTPIPQTSALHTLTRGAAGDHQVIIVRTDHRQALGSYDNVGGGGFSDTGFDVTLLAAGWHRLTVAAGDGSATFYIDGTAVGTHAVVSESDFFAVGNFQNNGQPWGYLHRFRIYDGTNPPAELPRAAAVPDPMVAIDVVDGEIVFGGTATYAGAIDGSPSVTAGPSGARDAILFSGTGDMLRLGTDEGVDTDASWTVDCNFKTPIQQTGAWHTLTRGAAGDHQVIINPDQASLGSYDNVGGTSFSDTGFDITALAPGWHRLTVAAGDGAATFFVDGESVGSHSVVSESDFYAIGNYQGGSQQWGYMHSFRLYEGTHTPAELPQLLSRHEPMVSIDVVDGEIVFGGTASYDGVVQGNPSIVAGPTNEMNAILFSGDHDQVLLGSEGIETDASWTVDCFFKTPIPQTSSWHTLTRGHGGDHQVIINPDQVSLGSYDNVGGGGFSDTGYDITALPDGWHRLTVSAGEGSAHFYLDGTEVGSHSVVSESDFYSIGNHFGSQQQWGYMYGFRIYDGMHPPSELQEPGTYTQTSYQAPVLLVAVDVEGGEIVFGGTASYDGVVLGSPTLVAGPRGATDAILFSGSGDMLQLGTGVDTDASWTVDCYFKTPIDQTGAWHTLTRGASGDHQIIINPDQASLGSYDNVGGASFTDTGFDITDLADGWHRLTVSAGEGSAHFYVDGAEVGSHSVVSESDFFTIGNYQGGSQQWGYLHRLRIYDGTHRPSALPPSMIVPDAMISIDIEGGQVVFGGTATYDGSTVGNPQVVAGPSGAMDALLFTGDNDRLELAVGDAGVDTDASWTVDCFFKTPIPQTSSWHTLTRGHGGDHQVIINPDQVSLGSYDNVGGGGFSDTGYDITALPDGWHRLTVSAGEGSAHFYLDGKNVGGHSTVSESDFFSIGNHLGGGQQAW